MSPRVLTYGPMKVTVFENNSALGSAAAEEFAQACKSALTKAPEIAIILATGNSQFSFVDALAERSDIEWSKISVFHMDEYIGMDDQHPASFRRWMRERVVAKLHPKQLFGIEGDAPSAEAEVARYSALLAEHKPSICVMGIGENGHLAFNDPPADLETKALAKIVELDDLACRMQQVGEGHFATLDDVPLRAISLTVHCLMQPEFVFVLTPEKRKAKAVLAALTGEVTPMCPASVLRNYPQVRLYLDEESASLL